MLSDLVYYLTKFLVIRWIEPQSCGNPFGMETGEEMGYCSRVDDFMISTDLAAQLSHRPIMAKNMDWTETNLFSPCTYNDGIVVLEGVACFTTTTDPIRGKVVRISDVQDEC